MNRDNIALIVSGRPPIDATRAEWRVAVRVQRYGERLERKGFLPALRRAAMVRLMIKEMAQQRVTAE